VVASPLAARFVEIYRLAYESERWQAANGRVEHPRLVLELLEHRYDTLLEDLAGAGFPGVLAVLRGLYAGLHNLVQ
jgi:hypothetical protein